METLCLDTYRREKQQQEHNEDLGHVTLTGIVSANSGDHCFKVKGDEAVLQRLKQQLTADLKEQGYHVKVEHGYHDE